MENVTDLRSRRFTKKVSKENGLPEPSLRKAYEYLKKYVHILYVASCIADPDNKDYTLEDDRTKEKLTKTLSEIYATAKKERDPYVRRFLEDYARYIEGTLNEDPEVIEELNEIRASCSH